jgi:hypothetical protein
VIPKGSRLTIDSSVTMKVCARLGIDLGDAYIPSVIRKYYSPVSSSARPSLERQQKTHR